MSIFDNVIAGYKPNGIRLKKKKKEEIVETCLTNVVAVEWDEKTLCSRKALSYQRSATAAMHCTGPALKPKYYLDELTSALDPIATNRSKNCYSS